MGVDVDAETIDSEIISNMYITQANFRKALNIIEPSSMREIIVEIPNVTWEDIGGLEDVKQELQELILFPLEYPEKFE